MNGPDLVVRWIHVVAVTAFMGSILFALGARLPLEHLRRGRMVFHGSMGLILLTGLANYVMAMQRTPPPPSSFHMILGMKIVLALIAFGLATLALRAPRKDDDAAAADRRKHTLLAMAATVAIIVVLLIEIAVALPAALVTSGS